MPHDAHAPDPPDAMALDALPAALPDAAALGDLARRFAKARRAALLATGVQPDGADDELLARALGADLTEAHRRAFDYGLHLGRGFAKTHSVELELADLPHALGSLELPCLAGSFSAPKEGSTKDGAQEVAAPREAEEPALVLERAGCPAAALGPGACDFYREAIGGLVLGFAPTVRHTRYESRGHGDPRCSDLFYTDPESPLRFGPLPEELRAPLDALQASARLVDPTTKVEFLGVSEGVLLYRLARNGCGGEVNVQRFLEHGLRRRFPELSVLEVSPRAPLGEP